MNKKILMVGAAGVVVVVIIAAIVLVNTGKNTNSSTNNNGKKVAEYKEVDKSGLKSFEIQKEIFDIDGNTKMGKDSVLYYPQNLKQAGSGNEEKDAIFSEEAKDGVKFYDTTFVETVDSIYDATTDFTTKCEDLGNYYIGFNAESLKYAVSDAKLVSSEAVFKDNPNAGAADTQICYVKVAFPYKTSDGTVLDVVMEQGTYHMSSTGSQKNVIALYRKDSANADAFSRSIRAFENF